MAKKPMRRKSKTQTDRSSGSTRGTDEDRLEFDAEVIEKLPDNRYRVQVKEHIILAYVSGKMKMHSITIAVGDRVRVELTPYDLSRGRIVFRSR